MAVSCPRCGNPIEQDFGVAACPHCHAVLFINMDGQAQITSEEASPAPAEPTPEAFQEIPSFDQNPVEPISEMTMEPPPGEVQETEPVEWEQGTGIYESSEHVTGAISYTVKVEKIDTKEIRHLMVEALDDSKFQWDPREVLRTVKDGTLELKNLNPVKASVLVQRLRDLPVKISWKQNVYS